MLTDHLAHGAFDPTAEFVCGQSGDFLTGMANKGGVSDAGFSTPIGLAIDADDCLYVADFHNHRVLVFHDGESRAFRVYGQAGDFTTQGENRNGVSVESLCNPMGVAVDPRGNVYIADEANHRVLFFNAGETSATRIYGQADACGHQANNGGAPVDASSLFCPRGLALDSNDNLYVADCDNHRVLFFPAGQTVATRVYGQADDLGSAEPHKGGLCSGSLSYPVAVAVDAEGNVYIVDGDHRVLRYPAGSTTAGQVWGQPGFDTDAPNAGGISARALYKPEAIVFDRQGNRVVSDCDNNRVLIYAKGSPEATVVLGQPDFTSRAENSGGLGARSLWFPTGLALNRHGDLYVADTENHRVLRYGRRSAAQRALDRAFVPMMARQAYGQPDFGSNSASGRPPVTASSLCRPHAVAAARDGGIYVADRDNHRVLFFATGQAVASRVYGQAGNFTTKLPNKGGTGPDSLSSPYGVAVDHEGGVYISDSDNDRVLYVAPGGSAACRVYGQLGNLHAGAQQGDAATADTLRGPTGLCLDEHGNLYVADSRNHRVLFFPAGSTTAQRVYGQSSLTSGDRGRGSVTADSLYNPAALAFDSRGNLYVADLFNHRVVVYPRHGTVATRVYGQGGRFDTRDENHGGISADSLLFPNGVALDRFDNLYVADRDNHRVLFFPAGSTTATGVLGQQQSFSSGRQNCGGLGPESFLFPIAVAIDAHGQLLVADANNHRVIRYGVGPVGPSDAALPTRTEVVHSEPIRATDGTQEPPGLPFSAGQVRSAAMTLSKVSAALDSMNKSHMFQTLTDPKSIGTLKKALGDLKVFSRASTAFGALGMGLQIGLAIAGVESPEDKILKGVTELKAQLTDFQGDVASRFKRLGNSVKRVAEETRIFDHKIKIEAFKRWTDLYWEHAAKGAVPKAVADQILQYETDDLQAAFAAIHKTTCGGHEGNVLEAVYNDSRGSDEVRRLALGLQGLASSVPLIESTFWRVYYQDKGAADADLATQQELIEDRYGRQIEEITNATSLWIEKCLDFANFKANYVLRVSDYLADKDAAAWPSVGKFKFFQILADDTLAEVQKSYPWMDWMVAIYDGVRGWDNHGFGLAAHRGDADMHAWLSQGLLNAGELRVNVLVCVKDATEPHPVLSEAVAGRLGNVVASMTEKAGKIGPYGAMKGEVKVGDVKPYLDRIIEAEVYVHLVRKTANPIFRTSKSSRTLRRNGSVFCGYCFV